MSKQWDKLLRSWCATQGVRGDIKSEKENKTASNESEYKRKWNSLKKWQCHEEQEKDWTYEIHGRYGSYIKQQIRSMCKERREPHKKRQHF